MIKKLHKTFLAATTILMMAVTAQAAPFIEGLEDVPMPQGMKQLPSDNVSFGNEESRLVEAYLQSSHTGFKAVEKFYMETLPQLGWSFQGKSGNLLSFYRDGEKLDIVKESSNPLKVRITLKSQN